LCNNRNDCGGHDAIAPNPDSGTATAEVKEARQGTRSILDLSVVQAGDEGKVRAVIHHSDGLKLQVDVVGLDLTALIDTWQVVG